jgi:hypothetical protein
MTALSVWAAGFGLPQCRKRRPRQNFGIDGNGRLSPASITSFAHAPPDGESTVDILSKNRSSLTGQLKKLLLK